MSTMTAASPQRANARLDDLAVLLVDDEPSVLAGLSRLLHGHCIVHTEQDPQRALERVTEIPDLAIVVSDMRMPGMDGATFLSHVRTSVPDAVRILLTGYADLEAAVASINDGRIFRLLWKPCRFEDLMGCLGDAAEQYRLITAERELLEATLRGSIRALVETLSLANPVAFSRAERIQGRVSQLVHRMKGEPDWEIEVAAMLSQLGAVTLPPSVTESLHQGDVLTEATQQLVDRVPTMSVDLLDDVPRLENVRRAILLAEQRFDGRGPVAPDLGGDELPLGARILRVAIDYDALDARGMPARTALAELRSKHGRHDPAVLEALEQLLTRNGEEQAVEQVGLQDLQVGMVLAADIMVEGDVLLCGRGQEVTQRLLDRLENWSEHHRIIEPIMVLHATVAAS